MGVKGLTSFVKDNQQSICKTVVLEQRGPGDEQPRIPIIVDAWGIIYQLWLSSLPWTSGGEYLRFYRLVHRLVSAWRSVGLEPIFMFDGSAPSSKIDTILSRLDDQLRAARLFYTTSATSRSAPSFSRSCGKIILPPLASQTFNHALRDLGVETHFMPVGEADGACVTLAEEREGFVFGNDSDYFVLIATVGLRRVRGYCPTDMMTWVDDDSHGNGYGGASRGQSDQGWSQPRYNNYGRQNGASNYNGQGEANGWSTAAPRPRPAQRERESPLLPPADARNPKLLLRVVTPNALRARLRLPPQMMPLFGALIGNDHTPRIAQDHFFEPGLHGTAKVDRVARVIREVVFSPTARNPGSMAMSSPSGVSTPNGSDAGDHAYQLVKRVMAKLAQKPFMTEAIQTEVMEGIIEATVQYALPSLTPCCGEYPFCGEVDRVGGCENAARAWAEDAFEQKAAEAEVSKYAQGRAAYAAAQRKGLLNHAAHVYLFPNRILMWQTMEDPSGPSLKAEEGARGVRTAAYLHVEQTLGTLRWEEEVEEEEYTNNLAREEGDTGVQMTQEEEDRAARRLLGVDTPIEEDANTTVSSEATAVGPDDLQKAISESAIDQPPRRHMVEFARHTNRHSPFRIDLPSALDSSSATSLAPLKERLHAFLVPLHSATPLILALPPCLQPIAAYVRFCVVEAARRAERAGHGTQAGQYKWTAKEVEAMLKAAVGSLACWAREKTAVNKASHDDNRTTGKPDEPVMWPELLTRNCQIISQLTSIMTDALYLAQALLLLPDVQLEEGMTGSPIGTKRKVSGQSSASTNSMANGTTPFDDTQTPRMTKVDAQMPTLTHLAPFVFFSGISLHILLRDETPPGWQWSERDESLLQTLLAAVQEELPGGTVKGWTGKPIYPTASDNDTSQSTGVNGHAAVMDAADGNTTGADHAEDSSPKSRKGKKNKRTSNGTLGGKSDAAGKVPPSRGGRCDLLGTDMP